MTYRVTEVECPLCKATGLNLVSEGVDPRFDLPGRFKVLWWARCEVGSTYPRLSLGELHQYYPETYDTYRDEMSDDRLSRWRKSLILVEERFGPAATDRIAPGTLLDVGCGSGRYMAAMARRGFDV